MGRVGEKGREIMLTPSLLSRNERGKHWLRTKVQQFLADNAVTLATPQAKNAPSCYWGTGAATGTTLYVLLAGDPEPKALPFRRTMIAQCGAGLYFSQHNVLLWIHRTLKKMGLLSA